jgi:probable phosphoglycerate mutase
MTTAFLLARHGHATSGPDHRWDASDPLTATGLAQADELGAAVAARAERPDRIVASPAVRAQQTAAACAAALGLEVETDPRLMEFGSGALSPFTLSEMLELAPYDDIWHPDDSAWDGETIGSFWRRTGEAAEAVWQAGGRPLVVSHVGTIQGILRWAMGVAPESPDSFALLVDNASLTDLVVRLDRHGRRRAEVHRLGATDHLTMRTAI